MFRRDNLQLIIAVVALIGGHGTIRAQCIGTEKHKLTASDGDNGVRFGETVSVDGEWAAVGRAKPRRFNDPPVIGSVYLFRFDGTAWVETQKITASDGTAGNRFGTSVALAGSVMVVGAPARGVGAAYVHRFDGSRWVEEQKLVAGAGNAVNAFGRSVSLHGHRILIGAHFESAVGGQYAGAAYVFRLDGGTWTEEARLTASDGSRGDGLGFAVSLKGDLALVSAWQDDHVAGGVGSAYVFRRDGFSWAEEQKLIPTGVIYGFGVAVSVDEGIAVVAGNYTDSSYLFRHDGTRWVEEQTLPTKSTGYHGEAVAVDGDRAVIAGLGVFLYRFNGTRWVRVQELVASDATVLWHADSVSFNGDVVMIGVGDGAPVDIPGAAYAFEFPDLALHASQESPAAGDELTITTCGGATSGILAIVEINGAPWSQVLSLTPFDPDGQWQLRIAVPSEFAGLELELQSFGFIRPLTIGASNRIHLSLR